MEAPWKPIFAETCWAHELGHPDILILSLLLRCWDACLTLTTSEPMDSELMTDLLAAVEQQLESPQTRYVSETLERLTAAGASEEQAREMIAKVLGEISARMLEERSPFDADAYRQTLAELGPPN